jgi:hypothetical protein
VVHTAHRAADLVGRLLGVRPPGDRGALADGVLAGEKAVRHGLVYEERWDDGGAVRHANRSHGRDPQGRHVGKAEHAMLDGLQAAELSNVVVRGRKREQSCKLLT